MVRPNRQSRLTRSGRSSPRRYHSTGWVARRKLPPPHCFWRLTTAASWQVPSSASTAAWPRSKYEMTLNTDSGLDGEYMPSPVQRVRRQVEDYESSGGVEGATLEGRPVVILTSVGAESGKVRKNPVIRIVDGDRYVAVASNGGAPTNPSWYTNLVTHPAVRLQDGATVKDF